MATIQRKWSRRSYFMVDFPSFFFSFFLFWFARSYRLLQQLVGINQLVGCSHPRSRHADRRGWQRGYVRHVGHITIL